LRLQAIGNHLVTERGYRLVNSQYEDRAMAKRKKTVSGSETATPLESAPERPTAAGAIKDELPAFESPPISPGGEQPVAVSIDEAVGAEPEMTPGPGESDAPVSPAAARFPFKLNARRNRNALLAASVALAAGFGAVVGAVASGNFVPAAPTDVAGLQERKAMEQSIAQLSKEITTLKANIVAANKVAHSEIAKISDKIAERAEQPKTPEITGSIPTPRPAPGVAATPPARPPVVKDWAIRDTRGGLIYVQGHGDIYQVAPGAPLPGLGPVQSIKRQDGRWVVTTPKGIIVSMRDRRYFE
jgi:hypothetical protein